VTGAGNSVKSALVAATRRDLALVDIDMRLNMPYYPYILLNKIYGG
jgi:hypothetical protein